MQDDTHFAKYSTILPSSVSVYLGSRPLRRRAVRSESFDAIVTIPSERYYTWLILLIGGFNIMVGSGVLITFGAFVDEFKHNFETTALNAILPISILFGMVYSLAPIYCSLINRYGIRLVGVYGGFITAVSLCISGSLGQLWKFILVYSICGGFGLGMLLFSSILVGNFYFNEWRNISTKVIMLAEAVGIVIFPPLLSNLWIRLPSWLNKEKLLAILCFICSVLSISFYTIYPLRATSTKLKSSNPGSSNINYSHSSSDTSIYSLRDYYEMLQFEKVLEQHTIFPTISSAVDISASFGTPEHLSLVTLMNSRRTSYASGNVGYTKSLTTKYTVDSFLTSTENKVDEDDEYSMNDYGCCPNKEKSCMINFPWCYPNKDVYQTTRPMYRDDILYSLDASKIRFMNHRKNSLEPHRVNVDYHIAVSRVITQRDLEEDYYHCICCPISIKRTLVTMLDFRLLRSPSFILVLSSSFFTTLGMYTPFIYLNQFAMSNNIKVDVAIYLISTMGAANCLGRIICGAIGTIPEIGALNFSAVCLMVCGIGTVFTGFYIEVYYQFAFAGLYGITIAAMPCLRSVMLVDMFGLERLTNAYGLVMLFQGMACLVGLPLAGYLIDYTGTYDACFVFSGAVLLVSGFMLLPVRCILNKEKRKLEVKPETLSKSSKHTRRVVIV